MIRFAIFDLDGTLVDSRVDLCLAVNHALRAVGLPERSLEEISSFVGEGAARLVERAVAPRLDRRDRALSAWKEYYQEHLLDHTVLFPGVAEVVAGAPFPLAVHTNKPGSMAREILRGLGIIDRFTEVVGGDEAPRKPHPGGTRALLERRGVSASEAVLVGDSIVDLELARAVPMRFVAVGWGLVAPERLAAAGASSIARDASELAKALELIPR